MGRRIKTNISSLNAQRQMGKSNEAMKSDMEKLASGYRINKSADDAAGMSISSNLTAKTRSMEQALRNANDGVSLIQVAEGGMNEITNILQRLRELATQAASDTIGDQERMFTNREYVGLVDEIERIANTTEFNGRKLLMGSEGNQGAGEGLFTIHVGAGDGLIPNTDTIRLNIDDMALIPAEHLNLGKEAEIGPVNVDDGFTRETAAEKLTTIDKALDRINNTRSTLGAQQSRLNSSINNLGIFIENNKAANSRIRDVDFAAITAQYTQNKILAQAGVSVLAQANNEPEMVMNLLR